MTHIGECTNNLNKWIMDIAQLRIDISYKCVSFNHGVDQEILVWFVTETNKSNPLRQQWNKSPDINLTKSLAYPYDIVKEIENQQQFDQSKWIFIIGKWFCPISEWNTQNHDVPLSIDPEFISFNSMQLNKRFKIKRIIHFNLINSIVEKSITWRLDWMGHCIR